MGRHPAPDEVARRGVRRAEGFLPIEDYGLIGDGDTAALVGRDGSIDWLCVPRFDSPPLFSGILDPERGGSFVVSPNEVVEAGQRYVDETGIVQTDLRSPSGLVRITDAMALRPGVQLEEDAPAGRGELLRSVEVLDGRVDLRIEVSPRGGCEGEACAGGIRLRCPRFPDLGLFLWSSVQLGGVRGRLGLERGARVDLVLRWTGGIHRRPPPVAERLKAAERAWRRWAERLSYAGPRPDLVRRSAITLKLLDHIHNGSIVAAPTSSLPEWIGGVRNWDYRYAWIRDAAFSVYALRRIGLPDEAWGFLGWVLDAVDRQGGRPRVLYDLDGERIPPEVEDEELRGYRWSSPVRWGNRASEQDQHDVFGEILDCAYQWMAGGGRIDERLWGRLQPLVEAAREEWKVPDQGIWEVRTTGRPFTYSAALCEVALDRGARIAERLGHPGDVAAWRADAERIRRAILEDAWNEDVGAIMEHLDGGGLDASVLALPLRRVIPAEHPRMVATCRAVRERLGAGDGLLYRYDPEESPDGLPGGEAAFLLCSFWLVDNLAWQGRLDEAMELYESLSARASPLGLLPEQIEPGTGRFLGNFPQAISHVGLISSGYNLHRFLERSGSRPADRDPGSPGRGSAPDPDGR